MSDSNWIEQATAEVVTLQAAAKENPKEFFGNRVRGMGEGLQRVKALLPAAKKLQQSLSDLDRVL